MIVRNGQTFRPMVMIAMFMISTFAIGTTEYVAMGILSNVSESFGITISAAGLIVSMYALGVAVLSPIAISLLVKFPRKYVLIGLMLLFIGSSVASALAPNYTVLLWARVFSALMHGPFFAIAMVMASEVVPPSKKSGAVAAINGGLTISLMIGVPFGAYIGDLFDWRIVFAGIAGLGIISLLGIIFYVPNMNAEEPTSMRKELGVFKRKQVLFALAITVFGYSGVFTAYTYIEPLLQDITGFGPAGITLSLFLFGVGGVFGNMLSGRLNAESLLKPLMFVMASLTVILSTLTLTSTIAWLAPVSVLLLGMGAFGTVPILQTTVIRAAEGAPSIASASAVSAFNLANAFGAWVGGVVISLGLSLPMIGMAGAVITLLGLMLSWLSFRSSEKEVQESRQGVPAADSY